MRSTSGGSSGQRERSRRAAVLCALRRKADALGLAEADFDALSSQLGFPPEYERGRPVVMPGDRPGWLHVVGLGAVRTIVTLPDGRRFTVQIAKPGHIVGLTPVDRRGRPGRFGAVAHERASIVQIGRELAQEVIARIPRAVWLPIAAYQARALSRMLLDVCRLYRRPISERILLRLRTLARDFPVEGRPGAIGVRLRQHDIAELVGADRGTVNRALRRLGRAGIVRNEAGRLVVSPGARPPGRRADTPVPREVSVLDDDSACRRRLAIELAIARQRWALPADASRILLERAPLRRYLPGEPISLADARQSTVLVSGAARVECDIGTTAPLALYMAKPGETIGAGWTGARGEEPSPLSAVAYEESTVAGLSPDVMLEVAGYFAAERFMDVIGYHNRAVCRRIYDRCVMLNLSAPDALLYQMRILAADFPEPHADGTVIALDLTGGRRQAPRMLAGFLGRTPSCVTRAFSTLGAMGHVAFVGPENRILVKGFYVRRLAG